MATQTWIAFAIVSLAVSALPGPAFVTVLSSALRRGWRTAPFTIAGILVGDAIFFALAALGLGAILVTYHPAFVAIKWLGIAYLTYLGVRSVVQASTGHAPIEAATAPVGKAFSVGLTTQLANPKIIVFLGALVPQFVNPAHPVSWQFALLGLTFMLSDALVFGVVAACAARAQRLLATPKAERITNRIAGTAMLAAAGRIAIER